VTVSVVLFDLDDTLFAHRASVDRGIVAHLAAIGGYSDADPTALWHDLEEHHYHRYLSGELDFEGQRRARATDFAASQGFTVDDPSAWFNSYFEHYRAAWHLHDDTLPLLAALTQRTGIITNGDPAFQQRKLDQVGLSFEHVVASGSLGFTKPDARIFEHAVSLYGVAPSDACYVGDRFETDALGAAAAGLLGVWLDRGGAATDAQLARAAEAGVRVIHSLAELPGHLWV
jgi:putative hydrolase of the HAD superfamily